MKQSPRSHIRRLALGRFISITGGGMAYTALGYVVWERTNDFWLQSLSLLLTFGITGLVGPFAGALGDRFDRRSVMALSEGLAALAFFAMATTDRPTWLIAFAFASALFESPFWSSSRAAIPNLAEDEDQISWANSLFGMGWSAGIALGPVVAGVLLALTQPADASAPADPSLIFLLNGVSFLVSLGLTLSVRGRFSDVREAEDADEHRGLLAGARYLMREPVLARMIVAFVVFVLGLGMGMVADAALAQSFTVRGQIPFLWFSIDGSVGFGLLIACWGTGAFVGNWGGRWLNARREVSWLVFGSAGIAIGAFGVGFAPIFPLVLVSLLVFGIFDGLSIVAEKNGLMQRRTPDAVRARAFAAFEAVLSLGLAAAYLLAPVVLEAVGPRVTYRIGGAGALFAFVILLPLLRLLRTVDGRPELPVRSAAERLRS